ncbi:MAG: hypothetical protein HOE45_03355 [Gammaproteobacteria bacterium]|jgi:hypothetical protein|nr:hypothetical protein [Gammaproteobacteria bacterium]MBT4145910.1 hypothetical protein [Gammaproteobacteria bacterium]MBT5223059.1 hypothetical protein [Gammaproteobacteria bacterium]MBT5826279.1 hypothetical protein [Gammaproteobacteria bacterium]MBT6420518.1 hypothetical protein [Gammaproteobacteria bacterium]
MVSRVLFVMLLCSISHVLLAEGLYLQTVNNTKLTEKQRQKSLKKVKEHKEIVLKGELEVPPFHKRGKEDASLGNSFCTTCHLSPPHTKSIRSRTFMNMHTQYIACETCHFRPENVQLSYQWQDTRDASVVTPKSKLFRQAVEAEKKTKSLPAKKMITKDTYVINPFYKITPYYQQQAIGLRNDNAFTEETKKLWQQEGGALEQKAERRAMIHAPLTEKGPKCEACHNEKDPLLDLAELGATSYQLEKIQNNIVTQFFSRYKDEEQRIRIMNLLK